MDGTYILQPDLIRHLLHDLHPLVQGIDEGEFLLRENDGERDPGESAARSDVDDRLRILDLIAVHDSQGIQEVLLYELSRIGDGSHIDLLVPVERHVHISLKAFCQLGCTLFTKALCEQCV